MAHAAVRTTFLTAVALCAFAANSLLCRAALGADANGLRAIDPATFTGIRLASGACVLAVLVRARGERIGGGGWRGGLALCAYAVAFSLAYLRLAAGTGALILFGAVQVTMITSAVARGERLSARQWIGALIGLGGLVALVLPGLDAPDGIGAASMSAAGVAWGIYSLLGRGSQRPLATTAHNFLLSLPIAIAFLVVEHKELHAETRGVVLAIASGAVASGLGYAVWYTALRGLTSARAAVVQLAVPVLAALGGAALLAEVPSVRLVACSAVILAGIACAVLPTSRTFDAGVRGLGRR